jgi:hypothetical protein
MISRATPAIKSQVAWLEHIIPLPLLELSHFIGSIAGVALVLLAHGLQRRIDAAYFLIQSWLWALSGSASSHISMLRCPVSSGGSSFLSDTPPFSQSHSWRAGLGDSLGSQQALEVGAAPKSYCQGCGCQSGQGYASLYFSPQSLNGLDVDRVR